MNIEKKVKYVEPIFTAKQESSEIRDRQRLTKMNISKITEMKAIIAFMCIGPKDYVFPFPECTY